MNLSIIALLWITSRFWCVSYLRIGRLGHAKTRWSPCLWFCSCLLFLILFLSKLTFPFPFYLLVITELSCLFTKEAFNPKVIKQTSDKIENTCEREIWNYMYGHESPPKLIIICIEQFLLGEKTGSWTYLERKPERKTSLVSRRILCDALGLS